MLIRHVQWLWTVASTTPLWGAPPPAPLTLGTITGDGMADLLALACDLSQKMLGSQLVYRDTLEAMVLEVKAIHGLGKLLWNGVVLDFSLRNTFIVWWKKGQHITRFLSFKFYLLQVQLWTLSCVTVSSRKETTSYWAVSKVTITTINVNLSLYFDKCVGVCCRC